MKHRFPIKLSVIILIAASILVMSIKSLNKTYINIVQVGTHSIKGFQLIQVTGPEKRNSFYVNDNKTFEEIIYAFNTSKYEKSSVKELKDIDCSVSFITEADGCISYTTGILISKDTIQINRDFYKCDPELYSRIMNVYNGYKIKKQIKSLTVNLPDGTKEVEYIFDGRISYGPYREGIDLYNASSSELEKEDTVKYPKEFGQVNDEAAAISAVSQLIYDAKLGCFKHEMPFYVKYNENARAWIIHGNLPSGYAGGVISVAINEDGKVLFITHGK